MDLMNPKYSVGLRDTFSGARLPTIFRFGERFFEVDAAILLNHFDRLLQLTQQPGSRLTFDAPIGEGFQASMSWTGPGEADPIRCWGKDFSTCLEGIVDQVIEKQNREVRTHEADATQAGKTDSTETEKSSLESESELDRVVPGGSPRLPVAGDLYPSGGTLPGGGSTSPAEDQS